MDFRPTDEQQMLVETARTLFERECPPALVRSGTDDPDAVLALFDRHLRDWVALGSGAMVDLCLFLQEAGAAVAPGPYLATAALFAPLLAAAGHPAAEQAAAGEIRGTVAVADAFGRWSPAHGSTRTQVIDLPLVQHVAVVSPTDGGDAVRLFVAEAGLLAAEDTETMDLARHVAVVDVPGHLDGDLLPRDAFDRWRERAVLAVAAENVGVARWLVDTAVAYAKQRVQFDKPIGAFQAVQHLLVDAALAQQEAAAAVAYAAMAVDADDPDRTRAVHVAKARSGLAARQAAKQALQVHGGVGYTWEHDLHLHLRRAYADDALLGTAADHLDALAALLFDNT